MTAAKIAPASSKTISLGNSSSLTFPADSSRAQSFTEEDSDDDIDQHTVSMRERCCAGVQACCFDKIGNLLQKRTTASLLIAQHKFLVVLVLVLLTLWNISKLPYFLLPDSEIPATDVTWDAARCANYESLPKSERYWCHGIEGSINLGQWHPTYRGGKLQADAVVFLSFHICVGSTALICAALTVLYPSLRRKYGYFFFAVCLLLGCHTMPAATIVKPWPKAVLFVFTCCTEIIMSLVGLYAQYRFVHIKPHSERLLIACWTLCAAGACGAGLAEFASMLQNIYLRVIDGAFPLPPFQFPNRPHPNSGHTVYDTCNCHGFGWFACIVWIALIWITLPIIELCRNFGFIRKNFWSGFLNWLFQNRDDAESVSYVDIAAESHKVQVEVAVEVTALHE